MRILLDVMGGDYPPSELIYGGIAAGRRLGIDILFAGNPQEIQPTLSSAGETAGGRFDVLPATEVVRMDDPPVRSVREKKDSSLVVGLSALARNEVDGFVSPANTGAVVAGSIFHLGRVPGIARPGILVNLPTLKGRDILVIDVGATSDCAPEHLVDFGLMGATYARDVLEIEHPTLGLLNMGTEKGKGNKLVSAAHELLAASPLPFAGNVEPHHLLTDRPVDVVVCDGFVGNCLLKATEGGVSAVTALLKRSIKRRFVSKIGALLLRRVFGDLRETLSYQHRGGAPLLGVNGVVVIAHGRSDRQAIGSAIDVAHHEIEADLIGTFSAGAEGWK